MRRILANTLLFAMLLSGCAPSRALSPSPLSGGEQPGSSASAHYQLDRRPFIAKNVILLIGDGMGLEHVKAGGMYLHGEPGTLVFEDFPYFAEMTTASENNPVTDSAASSTAMATGEKVNNYVVSQDIPGDSSNLDTLLEYASEHGLSTGLVTTSFFYDATPASFGAHTEDRKNYEEIIADYLNGSRPNVLLGGGNQLSMIYDFFTGGYTVVLNRAALLRLDADNQTHVAGLFDERYMPYEEEGMGFNPHLSEMAAKALDILDNDPDGFFVMIEGGLIDVASHGNKTAEMVKEVAEFDRTVQVVLNWAETNPDTLIVVLADHETGGIEVTENRGKGNIPEIRWTTDLHTEANVGVWAYGTRIGDFPETLDNTEIPALITGGRFR